MKNEKRNRILPWLSLFMGIVLFVTVLYFTFDATKRMAEDYHLLKEADLSTDTNGTIFYDDHLYGVIGFGIEISTKESGKEERRNDFLQSSIYQIDRRILSCLLLYTMMTAAVMSFFLNERRKQGSTAVSVLVIWVMYLLYLGFVLLFHAIGKTPFYFPQGKDLVILLIGLLSIMAGESALLLLLEKIPYKKITAIIIVPVVFLLFLFGLLFEHGLYCLPYEESFAYLADINPRILDENFEDEFYYDETRNVVILEGKEYPPESLENEEYYRGFHRIGAYLFELVNPYSGNGLSMILEADVFTGMEANSFSLWHGIFYVLKDICWLVFGLPKKKKTIE